MLRRTMRRYLKPALTVAAAGAAAAIVLSAGSPFEAAPAAKTKTIECRTTTTVGVIDNAVKGKFFTLPSIPKAQIPCTLPTISIPPAVIDIPAKLQVVQDRIVGLGTTTTTVAPSTTTSSTTSSTTTSTSTTSTTTPA